MLQKTFKDLNGDLEIYMDCLNAIIGGKRGSLIDLACCFAPNTPTLGFKKRRYIDIIDRKLDHKNEQPFFEKADILTMPFTTEKYDVAVAMDAIEHLTVDNGYKLLNRMRLISEKQILFTPTNDLFGFAEQNDNNPESHRSLWSPEQLEKELPNSYAFLVFPDYHKVWNGGAFFFWHSPYLQENFDRVIEELKTKHWYNGTD